jgi:hypothetical protein
VTTETQPGATEPGAQQSPLDAAFEQDNFADRPELFVGAAFVGGFVVARLLRLLRRGD